MNKHNISKILSLKKAFNINKLNVLGFYDKNNSEHVQNLESLLENYNVQKNIHPNKMSYNNTNFSFILFPHHPNTPFKKYNSYFMRPFNPHVIIADNFVDINKLDFVQKRDPLIPFIHINCLKPKVFYHMLVSYLEINKNRFDK